MIAIIYYQKITRIGVISIVLSLLSVSSKSLLFSTATTMNIFIFNWLSIVTDFVGIFCILSFVFYNDNDNSNSIITEWGYIWIYQSVAVWSIIWMSAVSFVMAPLSCRDCAVMLFFTSILLTAISFVCINIGLFAIIAYVSMFYIIIIITL